MAGRCGPGQNCKVGMVIHRDAFDREPLACQDIKKAPWVRDAGHSVNCLITGVTWCKW